MTSLKPYTWMTMLVVNGIAITALKHHSHILACVIGATLALAVELGRTWR